MENDHSILIDVTNKLQSSTKIKRMDISEEILFERTYNEPLSIYSMFVGTIIQ